MTQTEFFRIIETDPKRIKRLYTDGGTIGKNPSPLGGTWAWCVTDSADEFLYGESGSFASPEGREITNHQAEFAAMTRALEAMPRGWSGTIYSDSELTLNRFTKDYACFNIPPNMLERARVAVEKLRTMKVVLVQNKPTKKDLAAGIAAKSGLPVSKWNVWCDQRCRAEAQDFKAKLEAHG